MAGMSLVTAILEHPSVYRLWQAPFANKKLEPIFRHNDMTKIRRVLDVGCGPGVNTPHFTKADYLGIDFNEQYIRDARQRFKRSFVLADITQYPAGFDQRFDFILVNSILHHVELADTILVLSRLNALLTHDGHIHILELVRPEQSGFAQLLTRWDRGAYSRPISEWQQIFSDHFETVAFEPYEVRAFGIVLWNMIYFKGRAKQ